MARKFLGATAGILIPASAGAGLVLTSDASGNGTWQAAAGGGKALTGSSRSAASASFSTVVTTAQTFTPGAGEVVAGSTYEFSMNLRVINTVTASTLTVSLAVGLTNVAFVVPNLGTTANASPGRTVMVHGQVTFLSTTSCEGWVRTYTQGAVVFDVLSGTSAPVAVTAGSAINLNLNTNSTLSTIIVRQSNIWRIF